jgi:putative transposase
VLCTILEVSMSGYYAWRKRPMSEHQKEDALLTDQLQTAYSANRGVYGSPRLQVELPTGYATR